MSESSTSHATRLVICPYNLNHRIEPNLFADHLRACRLRYCRQNAQNLKLVRCRINSRHFLPDIEIEFHEQLCEDQVYRQIVAELKTEPIPVKIPSSDSSDNDDQSDSDTTTSVSSCEDDYSTSRSELMHHVPKSPNPK
uniref:CHHC U11-48K-type domain-containing protein n=1 Tax=Angiostrongylus cantonensis TaxID=6313 RepID=A0A0K0DHC7_ANGCA